MKRVLKFAGAAVFMLAWPLGNEVRKAYFPEAMLKRTEQVAVIENECKIRKFSTFIVKDKSIFSYGSYDLYQGSEYPTEDELLQINGGRRVVLPPEIGGLINYNYFGMEDSLQCMRKKMRMIGYIYQNVYGDKDYTWMIMDGAN